MIWLAGLIAVATAPLQTPGRAELPPEFFDAFARKDLTAAVAILEKAGAACVAAHPANDHCLDLMLGGANIAWRIPDIERSEKFARAAVAIADRALPAGHKDRGIATDYLLRTLIAGDKNAEAVPLLRAVIATRPPEHPSQAMLNAQLGQALFGLSRYAEAEVALRQIGRAHV